VSENQTKKDRFSLAPPDVFLRIHMRAQYDHTAHTSPSHSRLQTSEAVLKFANPTAQAHYPPQTRCRSHWTNYSASTKSSASQFALLRLVLHRFSALATMTPLWWAWARGGLSRWPRALIGTSWRRIGAVMVWSSLLSYSSGRNSTRRKLLLTAREGNKKRIFPR